MIDDEGSFRAPASPDAERRALFLSALREATSVAAAARASGWDVWAVYRVRQESPAFAAAWEAAVGRKKRPVAGPKRRWTAARKRQFIEALSETANVSAALRRVGLAPTGAYRLRRAVDRVVPGLRERYVRALDELEALAVERAKRGTEQSVRTDKRGVRRTRAPSDRLLMFLLRRHRPWRWGGETVEAQADGASAAEVRARIVAKVEAISARVQAEGEA